MHREEATQLSNCMDCSAEVSAGIEGSYAFGGAGVLCWECAIRRGGSYDAERDIWSVPPRVGDLEPEAFDAR